MGFKAFSGDSKGFVWKFQGVFVGFGRILQGFT